MPEIAEVETLRRDLARAIIGRQIAVATVTGLRSVRRHQSPDELGAAVEGMIVSRVGRLGKYVLVELAADERETVTMLIHLRMSGQVFIEPAGEPELKHTHVRLDFADGDQLRFVDPRTFGEVFACESSQLFQLVPSLAELGWDPLASPISLYRFRRQLAGRRRETKAFLLDQRNIAGLGNIYTDEVLFDARVRYDARTADLTPRQAGRLYRAILRIPADAAAAGGSSLRDEQYRRLSGELGRYQDQHAVYGREGEPCVRCGRPIRRAPYGGRSTFFCPRCQK